MNVTKIGIYEELAEKILKLESSDWVSKKMLDEKTFVMLTNSGAESIKLKVHGSININQREYIGIKINSDENRIYFDKGFGVGFCLCRRASIIPFIFSSLYLFKKNI